MDPIQQFGWRNRAQTTIEVGANLVRDVFVAADEVHSNAMSVMDGNAGVRLARTSSGDGGGKRGSSPGTESSVHPCDSVDLAAEGEHDKFLECMSCTVDIVERDALEAPMPITMHFVGFNTTITFLEVSCESKCRRSRKFTICCCSIMVLNTMTASPRIRCTSDAHVATAFCSEDHPRVCSAVCEMCYS